MHPQLEAERFISCHEYIEALNKCHKKQFYKRMFGICNNEKDALTQCLKEASFQTKKNALLRSKEKKKKIEEKWKKIDEEELGDDDKILKIILERQIAKRNAEQNSK